MKKFLFLTVAVLLVGRMTAQTIDTTDLNQQYMPTVILLDSDFDDNSTSVNDASTLLNSSRDVFNTIAAYNFGSLRYRVRGNDSKYSDVMINGILMNDPRRDVPSSVIGAVSTTPSVTRCSSKVSVRPTQASAVSAA